MTVKELIEELQEFPPHYQVEINDYGLGCLAEIESVELTASHAEPVVGLVLDSSDERELEEISDPFQVNPENF